MPSAIKPAKKQGAGRTARPNARTKRTHPTRDFRKIFLEHLAKTANVTESCRIAGCGRTTVHEWRRDEPDFAAAWDDALDAATDALEFAARQRAVDGIEEYVVSMGQIVRDPETGKPLKQKKYSDALTALLLKAHRPERFRERHEVKQTGNVTLQFSKDDADL